MRKSKQGVEQEQNDEVEQIEMKIVRLTRIVSNSDLVLHGETTGR